jgi:hypothetical protein
VAEPAAWLWTNYIRLKGYRDGVPGLIVAVARAYYSFMLAAKTWDLARLDRRLRDRDRIRDHLLEGYPTGMKRSATGSPATARVEVSVESAPEAEAVSVEVP